MSRHTLHADADVSGLVADCAACVWIARDPVDRGSPELRRRLETGDLRTPLDRRARAAIPGVDPLPGDDVELVGPVPRCEECGRAVWNGHWPWCSSAAPSVRATWGDEGRRRDLRALRTVSRLEAGEISLGDIVALLAGLAVGLLVGAVLLSLGILA